MNDNKMLFGIIGLLVIAVVGLAIDRSSQITALTQQVTDAQVASDDMAATIEAQSSEIEAQAESVTASEDQIATLEADAEMMAVSATQVSETISELEESVSAFEEVNGGMATEIADLSTENDDLSGQVDDLSAQVADLTTENEDLSAQVDDLSTQVAESVPTETPSPEPTIEAEASAQSTSDLEFVFTLDVANRAVQISPDSTSIAVLGEDNVLQLFSATDGTPQIELADFDGELSDFIYSGSGRAMAAIVDGTSVVVFDSATAVSSFADDYGNPITGYDLSADGTAIIAGTARNIEIALLGSSQKQTRQDGVTSLDWSADGSQVVIANGRSVSLLVMSDNTIDSTTSLDTTGVSIVDVTISPDGTSIAGVSVDGELVMISVESGSILWQTGIDAESIDDLAWSGDSQYVAVVADGDLRIYGVDGSFAVEATMEGANGVAWSSDGAFLALSNIDQVGIVDVASLME